MGYTIEISFSMVKHPNTTELRKYIGSLALDYNCMEYYYHYEMEGGSKIPRNHCVIVVSFIDDNIADCSAFIKVIRKIPDVYLECIYEDNIQCKLIYASRYYLTCIDKDKVIVYNQFKRERSHSDNEKMVLSGVIGGGGGGGVNHSVSRNGSRRNRSGRV